MPFDGGEINGEASKEDITVATSTLKILGLNFFILN